MALTFMRLDSGTLTKGHYVAPVTPGEPQPPQRGRGRPALISRDLIIGRACELGLDGLSMSKVANELGVATQSLYRHVASRKELVTLCVNELVQRWVPVEDRGQSDEDWLYEYAQSTRRLLLDHPGLAVELQSIGPGTPEILHMAESSIGSLVKRGFPVLVAYLLIGSVAEATIAAVIRIQRFPEPLIGQDVANLITLAAIDEVDSSAIPHISSITEFLADTDGERYFMFTSKSLISGMLARLGELGDAYNLDHSSI